MATGLQPSEVHHVAKLARLALTPEEEERTRLQLSAILEAVESLSQVVTHEIEPTSHASLMGALWREDRVVEGLTPDQALANAPERIDTGFAVPRIIE